MTREQFNQFIDQDIPQALFHVSTTDKDATHGCRADELILLNMLHANPAALKYMPLIWFVETFIDKAIN